MEKFLVEGRALDTQQMACVTQKYHNHLVVAGAGTGKTTTIIGKIRWLLEHKIYKPEEILVLSFTNASAAEMRERILKEVPSAGEITAATFHKLGLEILKKVKPDSSKISRLELTEFVREKLCERTRIDAGEKVSRQVGEELDGDAEMIENIVRVISLARTNDLDLAKFLDLARRKSRGIRKFLTRAKIDPKDVKTLELTTSFNAAYEEELREAGEIDFADMINLATEYVETGKYRNPFKFVIVDEYQDISLARYGLLKALRESQDYDLFCVGDDWQAIYRFAGSEIDLILNFEKYWGKAELSKIETTYRFPQTLAEASGKFVMENLAQISKKIKALPDSQIEGRIDYAVTEVAADSVREGLEYAAEIIEKLPKNATVYFLGRYTFDERYLQLVPNLKWTSNENTDGKCTSGWKSQKRPDLKIEFLTVHKSKGLQADYVFVINMKDGKRGFPSQIVSAPIIKMLNGHSEKYPNAEERRLFYVAMTRAKRKVYLLTTHMHKSAFILELEDLLYKKMPIVNLGIMGD